MATNSEPESETKAELDVLTLMHEKLPQYVVNCLLASGFDVADVIMSMDVSEQPGNSIETIENYINDHYAGHEDYCNTPVSCSVTPFVFPPGHRFVCSSIHNTYSIWTKSYFMHFQAKFHEGAFITMS